MDNIIQISKPIDISPDDPEQFAYVLTVYERRSRDSIFLTNKKLQSDIDEYISKGKSRLLHTFYEFLIGLRDYNFATKTNLECYPNGTSQLTWQLPLSDTYSFHYCVNVAIFFRDNRTAETYIRDMKDYVINFQTFLNDAVSALEESLKDFIIEYEKEQQEWKEAYERKRRNRNILCIIAILAFIGYFIFTIVYHINTTNSTLSALSHNTFATLLDYLSSV